jgi:hypothetical protein
MIKKAVGFFQPLSLNHKYYWFSDKHFFHNEVEL